MPSERRNEGEGIREEKRVKIKKERCKKRKGGRPGKKKGRIIGLYNLLQEKIRNLNVSFTATLTKPNNYSTFSSF